MPSLDAGGSLCCRFHNGQRLNWTVAGNMRLLLPHDYVQGKVSTSATSVGC